jgi:hypothetical protein
MKRRVILSIIIALIFIGTSIAVSNIEVSKISNSVIGTWQSVGDEDYIVLFDKFGNVHEEYADKLKTDGTWSVSRKVDFVDTNSEYQKVKGYFLTTVIEDKFIYSVEKITEEELILFDIAKGGALNFKRIIEEDI